MGWALGWRPCHRATAGASWHALPGWRRQSDTRSLGCKGSRLSPRCPATVVRALTDARKDGISFAARKDRHISVYDPWPAMPFKDSIAKIRMALPLSPEFHKTGLQQISYIVQQKSRRTSAAHCLKKGRSLLLPQAHLFALPHCHKARQLNWEQQESTFAMSFLSTMAPRLSL